ncbi:MAG: NAD(P)-dependent oxidoreductase [Cyclobacteriaceae bacterium]|nr:NAD(P)-dependent oxidoreductase [Cyclobacteriaceae bacterium]
MKNTILITGASGFIGSHLIDEALRFDWDVYASVRSTSNKAYLTDKRIHFVELDFSSQQNLEVQLDDLTTSMGGFDYVIHNAGITYAPKKEDFYTVNTQYTKNLVQALQAKGLPRKKFVLISSLAIYGPGNADTFKPIHVNDAPAPISTYAKSKWQGEQFVRSLHSFPYLILNPTAVYGPRDRDFLGLVKMVKLGLEVSIGSYRQMTSLIYVKDLARVVIAATRSELQYRSFLISDGQAYDQRSLAQFVKRFLHRKTLRITLPLALFQLAVKAIDRCYSLLGTQPFLNEEKVKEISSANWLCDSDEIWQELKITPRHTLQTGLEETLKWYEEQKWI